MNPEILRNLGFARVDLGRLARCGRPEIIFCPGKLPVQVAEIAVTLIESGQSVLATRAGAAEFEAVRSRLPDAVYHERARCITAGTPAPKEGRWTAGVICAGTADIGVAEEAAVSLENFGRRVDRIFDVGVAGLHRVAAEIERIRACGVLIIVAGMEGALPGVVAGLVDRPVIAVPTSVGYGASLGGLAALLGMLNCCASGVSVVNIDNGLGAACAADDILRLAEASGPAAG